MDSSGFEERAGSRGDRSVGSRLGDDKWGGIGMLLTEYAKGNELDFQVESLKVYVVLVRSGRGVRMGMCW